MRAYLVRSSPGESSVDVIDADHIMLWSSLAGMTKQLANLIRTGQNAPLIAQLRHTVDEELAQYPVTDILNFHDPDCCEPIEVWRHWGKGLTTLGTANAVSTLATPDARWRVDNQHDARELLRKFGVAFNKDDLILCASAKDGRLLVLAASISI